MAFERDHGQGVGKLGIDVPVELGRHELRRIRVELHEKDAVTGRRIGLDPTRVGRLHSGQAVLVDLAVELGVDRSRFVDDFGSAHRHRHDNGVPLAVLYGRLE